jgi:hypothetical protein
VQETLGPAQPPAPASFICTCESRRASAPLRVRLDEQFYYGTNIVFMLHASVHFLRIATAQHNTLPFGHAHVCMYVCIYFIYVCNCNLDSMSRRNNPIYCLLISPCRNMEVGPSTPYHTVQYLLLSSLQLGKGERCRREIVRRPGYHSNLRPRQAANLRVPAACDANEKAGPTGELPCNPVNSGKDPRQTPCRQAQERWEQCRYLVR